MITIGSVKEDLNIEQRISISPETVKKFTELNFSILLEKNYGEHLGITDQEFKNKGANFFDTSKCALGIVRFKIISISLSFSSSLTLIALIPYFLEKQYLKALRVFSLNFYFASPLCIKLWAILSKKIYFQPVIVFTSKYSSNPQLPPSRPFPDCLYPPKGVPGSAPLPLI